MSRFTTEAITYETVDSNMQKYQLINQQYKVYGL